MHCYYLWFDLCKIEMDDPTDTEALGYKNKNYEKKQKERES